jgi:hypothetical protein
MELTYFMQITQITRFLINLVQIPKKLDKFFKVLKLMLITNK